MNATYAAGLNYGNRNPSCLLTRRDTILGYFGAISSTLLFTMLIKKVVSNYILQYVRNHTILSIAITSLTIAASSGFASTIIIRRNEIINGIDAYEDKALT